MFAAKTILLIFSFFAVFAAAQFFFYHYTKRTFWRAFMPLALRKTLLPDDTVKMDSFTVIEEYAALFLAGSFMLLPIIAINSIDFISSF